MATVTAVAAWISVAVSVGTAVYAMTMTPDLDKKSSNAGTKITKNGTQSPRNRVYGTAIVGCTSVYSNVLDRDRSYRLDVFSVGGIGELTLHNVWIDDVRMFEQNLSYNSSPYDASSGIFSSGQMRPRYRKSDKFQMQWRSGHENQVAAQLAVDNSDGEWTTDHKGSKVPHIVIFADYTTDQDYVFFSDRYNITALVTGGAVYDPREADNDFEVPTTWTGKSSNVALAVYDYLTSTYYGMGIKPEYIDEASFAYAASFCDANGLEINSAIRADDSFAEILQDMLICCGGSLVISNGKIKFLVEEQELVTLYDLNDDLIVKDSLRVSPAATSDYYNVVSTTFKSEINRDNDDDFIIPADVTTDERVLQDGEVITKSIKMPYSRDAFESEGGVVNNGVKYITNVIYNKANFQSTVTFDLDLHDFPMLEPLSVISITNEAYGFDKKKFRVLSLEISTDSDRFNIARINAIEYDDSIYTGTLGGATSLPRPRPLDEIQPPKNLTFNLEAFVISGYGLLRWEHGSFTPSTAYDIEYRLATQTEWTRYRSAHKGDNIAMYDLKGDTYDFRVRTYDMVLGTSEWVELSSIEVAPNYTLPAVTNLKVDTSTPHFRFTWDDMSDVTVDNMPDPTSPTSGGSTGRVADIFKHYRVQLHVDGVLYVNETLTTNQFTFFYEDNKALFGTAKREVTLTVVMVDKYGVTSAQNSLVASNDQLGVATGIKTTNTNGNATIEWEPRNEPDFEGTLIFVSSVSGFTPSDSNLHAVLGKESFYVYNFDSEDKSDRYMRIAHFDTMGRDSVTYSPEIVLSFNGAMDAKLIRLISESQVFAVDKYGTPSRDSITFTASTQNTTGDVTWTVNPSVALTTTANPNERVLSYSNMGNHEQVTVTVSCDGVTDVVSVYKVRDGQDGKDGQDGQNGQNGQDGKDGDTIYEQYRYGQVVTPDASWTQWGEDMRSTDIYRQTRLVTNGVGGNPGTVHRISGIDGNNGQDGERVFVIYHKNPVGTSNRPSTPTDNWANEGWSEDSQDAHWMSQKVAKAIDEELTFWSFPIALTGDKGEDGVVDYDQVNQTISDEVSQLMPLTLVARNGLSAGNAVEVKGLTVTKTEGGSSNGSPVHTVEQYAGGVAFSLKLEDADLYGNFGLCDDQRITGGDIGVLNAHFRVESDGKVYCRQFATTYFTTTWAAGDVITLIYNGKTMIWKINGVEIYRRDYSFSEPLGGSIWLGRLTAKVSGISLVPLEGAAILADEARAGAIVDAISDPRLSNEGLTAPTTGLFANPRFYMDAKDGRPLGAYACYGDATPSSITRSDDSTHPEALVIYNSSDTSTAGALTAFPVNPNQRYKIRLRWRSGANNGSGVYFRVAELDSELPATAKFISGNEVFESGGVQGTRQLTGFFENQALSTAWTDQEFTYTPTSTAKWASLMFLNWTGNTGTLRIAECTITPITGALANKDNLTAAEVGAETPEGAQSKVDSRIPAAQAEKLGNITGSSGLSFYKKIVVNGDADTYYPVIVHGGHQDVLRTIKIWRRYNETAPNTWNTSTHKGALMFTWLGNFGGWGGARYRSTILEYGEVYSNMIAHCYRYNHSQAMVFFLRGGGAVYHMGSDQTLDGVERENPSGGGSGIYYSSSIKSFVSSYSSSSDVYAPAPMSSPDLDALRDQMKTQNSLGQYIKNLNADNITAGKVSAQYVQADVYDGTLVNASNINVGQLNAKHINTETFTGTSALFGAEVQGGTITGAVVRTSSSGARAEMRETGYKFAAYDDNGNPTFYVENDGSVVMKAGRIESDVLDTIGSSSNIVSWVGETARGGEIKIDRSNIINNTVEYFPLPAFITTGEVGLLTARLFSSEGLLIQNEQSANWGEPAPAQKTLASTDSPRIHLVNTNNGVLTDLGYMKISYTTQSGNGTYNEKYNTGTYGWRKTYAHFYLEGVPADFKVSGGTNLQNYKVRVLTSHMATGDTLRAQAATFDTLEYVEQSVGGRYLPHSYKVVWEGYATTVTNEWGEGLYLIIGMDKGDWRRWGFVFVADKNENVDLYAYEDEARTIFATYSAAYVEYRYDTNIFRNSEGYVCKILKLTGR
ncbi:fibronectin type III domain-containing protein [Vibrio alginolyticus]|uniref:fibronectin type III domain-containing protein n=1 Tax=Vibrio alginolyticus TaxID=663 RepID=UPI002A00BECB|nr:fibronectin type III domain-containing protein [Vibrio parahaemolyticus]EJG0993671.1 fibronectin type III domain-containing protein [Vibrio parahaemolyticus]EJG1003436.1 fibronectin type III domain-containing protein [Vibrio parahaemolyticus]EJG1051528.1 fibronectin type III domain-containing protein [Vibrio parahaemolyticus]HCG7286873.1 fibronectin type III domain-containing protein [Vibrio parahaemolyticus]